MRRALLGLFVLAACADEPAFAPDAASYADANLLQDAAVEHDAEPAEAGERDAEEPDAGVPPLGPVLVDITATRTPALLSDYRFFRWENGRIEHNEELIAYELNTSLFSDHALKDRAVYVPAGAKINYQPTEAFEFPDGSAIIKSFLFPADFRAPEENVRLIETRVLIKYPSGWRAFPYLWREDGSDADYRPGGHVQAISFLDETGTERTSQYLVPQRNQCQDCHQMKNEAGERTMTIIGPKARYLHREHEYGGSSKNQLDYLNERGVIGGLPADLSTIIPAFDLRTLRATSTTAMSDGELTKAARDYLDINCAHCHNPNAVQGVTSQLFLNFDNTDLFRFGICKEPGSAGSGAGGLRFDIVPGAPEESIMVYRIETEMLGDMMPLIGRSLRDRMGTPLVRGFIERMPRQVCDE